jgi:CO dehydrogenase nickel-insertion accessory protein CooC1
MVTSRDTESETRKRPAAKTGSKGAVLIRGAAGVGKTALAAALTARLAGIHDILVVDSDGLVSQNIEGSSAEKLMARLALVVGGTPEGLEAEASAILDRVEQGLPDVEKRTERLMHRYSL